MIAEIIIIQESGIDPGQVATIRAAIKQAMVDSKGA